MRLAYLLPVFSLGLLVGACATAPKESTAPAPAAAPVAAAAAPAAAPASSGGDEFDTIDATNLAEAQAAGYKVVNEKGKQLLCRKDLITGTRLKYVTTCLTAMEWRDNHDAAREFVRPTPLPKPVRGN